MEAHKPPCYASCAHTPQDVSQGSYMAWESASAGYDGKNHVQPQLLESSWLKRILYLVFDLTIAAIALLFVAFALWIRKIDGTSAEPGSIGLKLYKAAQFAPTLYPLLFAAIVGGSIKSIASWKIQTRQGTTIGELEQCMGSQTISRAFATQIKLRGLNFLGLSIVCLWSLSPVGSQASLRVISVEADLTSSQTPLHCMNTFTEYQYGNAEGISEAITKITGPTIASLLAGSLLGSRFQDLWGNIRLPVVEQIDNKQATGWMTVPEPDNLTCSSLVGIPVGTLPVVGNTSFTLPGSYLAFSCPKFGTYKQHEYTNFTSSRAPSPGNRNDSSWYSSAGGGQYQMAISTPSFALYSNESRDARNFVWESYLDGSTYFRAECDLTTTYVDSNVTCSRVLSGGSSSSSSGSVCSVSSMRRSVTNTSHGNWTAFDIGFGQDAQSVLDLITGLFPYADLSGGVQPVLGYVVNPYTPFSSDTILISNIDRRAFEIRMAQIFNTVLYLGISPEAFMGGFNASESLQQEDAIDMTGMTVVGNRVIRCNPAWFAVLVVASFVLFLCALVGAILRLVTITPDVLGSISVALLHNKTQGVVGSSTWSSSRWAREAKDTRLCLADINPAGEVGCIALASPTVEGVLISRVVEKERLYL